MHVERLEWKAAKSVPPKRTQRLKVLSFDAEFPENGTCKCTWPSCESYVVFLNNLQAIQKVNNNKENILNSSGKLGTNQINNICIEKSLEKF